MATASNPYVSHSELHARQFYDRWIGQSGILSMLGRRIFRLSGQMYSQKFVDKAELKTGDRVLELGCGMGSILVSSHLKVHSRETYVGLDISYEMIKRAQSRRHQNKLTGQIVYLLGSALRLPFGERAFDVVLLSHLIKYLTDNQLMVVLNEAKRVLKNGGRIVLWEFEPFLSPGVSEFITSMVGGQKLRSAFEIKQSLEDTGFLDLSQFRIVTPWLPWRNVAFYGRL